jgi:hypothetical protein
VTTARLKRWEGIALPRSMVCLLVVLLTWGTSSFGNDSKNRTTDVGYPRIVAKIHLTGQTAPIPTTTVWTPKKSGLFRFSGVMVVTAASSQNGNWGTTIGFTPLRGGPTSLLWIEINSQVVGGGVSAYPLTVWDIAGQPLTYEVPVVSGNPQGSKYELFFTVEQLQ